MTNLAAKKCVPCEGGVPPLDASRVDELLEQVEGWKVENNQHLERTFRFEDFATGLAFVNQVGTIADQEGHHPDVHLAWGKVRIELWTHKINGLTESDFILAAKINTVSS